MYPVRLQFPKLTLLLFILPAQVPLYQDRFGVYFDSEGPNIALQDLRTLQGHVECL